MSNFPTKTFPTSQFFELSNPTTRIPQVRKTKGVHYEISNFALVLHQPYFGPLILTVEQTRVDIQTLLDIPAQKMVGNPS